MSNRFALTLALVIVVAILGDIFANDARALLFLLRKLADLIEYLAFWR